MYPKTFLLEMSRQFLPHFQADRVKVQSVGVTISGYNWARRHKREFSAVISIQDPGARRGIMFHSEPHPPHLVLKFVDLDSPVPAPFDGMPMFRLASEEQIRAALDFAVDRTTTLVHCHVGIARSPAVAMGIWMQQLQDEDAVFAELERVRPEAVPNRHVVMLIDKMLGSNLLPRLDAWDACHPWNRLRRLLCRKAYFQDGGIPLEPELVSIGPWDLHRETVIHKR